MTLRRPLAILRRGQALLALGFLLLAVLVQGRIEARTAVGRGGSPLLYLPSGKYLKAMSLGFDGLLADLIYLWSIQYYGNYAIEDRYLYLERIYGQVITELDPHYLDPYLVGALIMNVEARQPGMALRLLDKGMASNPEAWILPFEAGFLCYNDLHDFPRAAAYFDKALRVPGVHPLVRRLRAEMLNRAGDKKTSLREWAEIHATATDDYVRTVAWNHIRDLKVEVDLADLRNAVGKFRETAGRAPRRLEELASAALLAPLPRDPEDNPYLYDPATGEVSYRNMRVLAR